MTKHDEHRLDLDKIVDDVAGRVAELAGDLFTRCIEDGMTVAEGCAVVATALERDLAPWPSIQRAAVDSWAEMSGLLTGMGAAVR